MSEYIRNPVEWSFDHLRGLGKAVTVTGRSVSPEEGRTGAAAIPEVRRISIGDLRDVLARGWDDFAAYRTDVMLLCFIYPLLGIVLARLVFGYGVLPLLFPLASGFALVGPAAAVGLYEMSRRREQGHTVSWLDAFRVVYAPRFGAILMLSALLLAIFLVWMAAASAIYNMTLGPESPASFGSFLSDVFTTGAGWAMIVVGVGVGFLFAVLVLTISVLSFPLLLDRGPGLPEAISASVRAVIRNPAPMAAWGLVVVAGLVAGSIPLFLGLAVVLPVLGHATWHLYRLMARPAAMRVTISRRQSTTRGS
jgi:uncharacterized membrane protein